MTKKKETEWILIESSLPKEYDMCRLFLASGVEKKGWLCGEMWDGLHVKTDDVVVSWKKCVNFVSR